MHPNSQSPKVPTNFRCINILFRVCPKENSLSSPFRSICPVAVPVVVWWLTLWISSTDPYNRDLIIPCSPSGHGCSRVILIRRCNHGHTVHRTGLRTAAASALTWEKISYLAVKCCLPGDAAPQQPPLPIDPPVLQQTWRGVQSTHSGALFIDAAFTQHGIKFIPTYVMCKATFVVNGSSTRDGVVVL